MRCKTRAAEHRDVLSVGPLPLAAPRLTVCPLPFDNQSDPLLDVLNRSERVVSKRLE